MDSQVEEIKSRINIADVIGQYVKLERAGRSMRARCPFHKEKTPSFFVSPERGTYICFGCGEKGDIFSFVQKIDGVTFLEALQTLAERAGVTLAKRAVQSPEQKDEHERLFAACEEATKFFESQIQKRADIVEYLHSRAVSEVTQQTWRLGYAPASWEELSKHLVQKGFSKNDIAEAGLAARSEKKPGEIYDRFRGRIMFPIFDQSGKVIAFSGRFFEQVAGSHDGEEPAKYVNSSETPLFKKSRTLYGFDRAKQAIRKADCVMLVEGQFDLVMSHQSGLPFTVALSGTALTPEHLSLLSRFSKRLVLALDADAAGVRSGLRSAYMALAAGFDVKIPTFVGGKDPADIAKDDPEALRAAVRVSVPAVEFFLEVLRPEARDERAYKKLVEAQVVPLISVIESKIDQAHFISIVASRLGVPEAAVAAEAKKALSRKSEQYGPVDGSAASTSQPQGQDVSTHERAAAMLLFHFSSGSTEAAQVANLVGETRAAELMERLKDEAEKLRFAFDTLGEEEVEVARGLLTTIERGIIEEKLQVLQRKVRTEGQNNPGLLKELSVLKHRQEELRK